jgi:Ner family transcriptional regulator
MAKPTPGIHREDLKAMLRKRFGSLDALSRSWGLYRTTIASVLGNPYYSVPLERRIAEALNLHPHEIWPDRFSADGEALPRRRFVRSTPRTSPETSQKRRAA